MGKVITFKVPQMHPRTRELSTAERRGQIALLYVGNIQEKFVLQYYADRDEVESLVHYASGYKFGELNPIKLRSARSYQRMTDRAAAEALIADVLRVRSADDVRKIMAAMPIINGEG